MKRTLKISGLLVVILLGMATTFREETNKYFEILKNIEIFTNLYKEINTYYVDDLDPGQLMRTGIDAMMESLDPYTNYISESDIEGYRFMTEGRYNGIGAQSRKIGDFVTIVELYQNQPADKAGLKAGDQIIAVDGKDVIGKSVEQLNDFLRGFPGTFVELTIRRPGKTGDFKVSLERSKVEVENVPYYGMVRENVGYVVLTTFTREAGRNVANAVKALKKENPDIKGVILDLRGNGGGLLSEAVNVSNVFVPKGELIVTTKGKVKDWDRTFKTLNPSVDEEIPVTVLINKNSASASEIVCGVIQDYDRGVLIGQGSYGKGLVQNTRDIGYNAKVKLTTAKYYIPSGRCIQSVEYANGEPLDIPDSERTPFYTRNKRKVLDGGGVKPDVRVTVATDAAIMKALLRKNMIFHYVTDYCTKHDSIGPVDKFEFTEIDDFLGYLDEQKFTYDSESEKILAKLEKAADKEGHGLDSELKGIANKIKQAKKDEILKFKEDITKMIESEIATRYYYQNGKIRMGLKNDQEIEEAVQLLNDKAKYDKILSGK